MGGSVFERAVPNTHHVLSRAPSVVFCETEPNDRPALRPDEILARQPHSPAKPRCLGDDLIERVHRLRPSDTGDRLHVFAVLEQLHAKRDRPQLQKALQIGNELGPVGVHNGISRRQFSGHVNVDQLG